MAIRQSMREAGYRYVSSMGGGLHILEEIETGKRELWAANKGHAGYGIKWRGTDLEFCSSEYVPPSMRA